MVGVPDSDLISWQVSRSERAPKNTASTSQGMPRPKRPRVDKGPISAEQLRVQLEAHKALMSGATTTSAPPQLTPSTAANASSLPPPPSLPPTMPQVVRPPAVPAAPPVPPVRPAVPNPPPAPPAAVPELDAPYASPASSAPSQPTELMHNESAVTSQPSESTPPAQPSQPPVSENAKITTALGSDTSSLHPHKAALQRGQKSRLVYSDPVLSPEEKMASMPKYAYVERDDVSQPSSSRLGATEA